MKWYGISKLYVLMFAIELQKRLRKNDSKILTATAHPGLASTSLASNIPSPVTRFCMLFGMGLIGQSPKNGANSFLYASLSDNVKGGDLWVPGDFGGMRGLPVSKKINDIATDEKIADILWADTERITNTKFSLGDRQ